MPFGFERMEKPEPSYEQPYRRKYVTVTVYNHKDGKLTPLSFMWGEREFRIDKVLDCRTGRSTKYLTGGLRYRCSIKNKEFYLYYTGEKWYVELKNLE